MFPPALRRFAKKWALLLRQSRSSSAAPSLGCSYKETSDRFLSGFLDDMRDLLRPHTTHAAERCGLVPRTRRGKHGAAVDGVAKIWVTTEGKATAYITGATRCKSGHSCPVCTPVKREAEAQTLKSVVATWRKKGGSTLLLTLTIRHQRDHLLNDQLTLLDAAWKKFVQGSAWRRIVRRLNLTTHVHVIDPPHGRAGWHPHFHVLLFVPATDPGNRSARAARETRRIIREAWAGALERAMNKLQVPARARAGIRPSRERAVSLKPHVGTGEYMVKAIDWRTIVRSSGRATGRSRSPFEIMAGAARGSRRDQRLWREFTKAMLGRQIVIGLDKAKRAVGSSAPRRERSRPSAKPKATVVAELPAAVHNEVARTPGGTRRLLEGAVQDGLRGVALVVAECLWPTTSASPAPPPSIVRAYVDILRPPGAARDPSPIGDGFGQRKLRVRRPRRNQRIAIAVHRARVARRRTAQPLLVGAAA